MESVLTEFRVKHLAIEATPAFGVVEDLCTDPGFNGVILWDAVAQNLSPTRSRGVERGNRYADFFHEEYRSMASLDKDINSLIAAHLQKNLVTLSVPLKFPKCFRSRPQQMSTRFDRYRPTQYLAITTLAEREELGKQFVESERLSLRDFDPRAFDEDIGSHLGRLSEQARAKGGDLILVRMPTTGECWAISDSAVPKERFWDRIHDLSGVTTIHFRDYPELRGFGCPDGSHLDATDAPEFTRRLALILRKKLEEGGVLGAGVRPANSRSPKALPASR